MAKSQTEDGKKEDRSFMQEIWVWSNGNIFLKTQGNNCIEHEAEEACCICFCFVFYCVKDK